MKPKLASLAASAGLWLGQSYHFGMVRVGSALYGLNNAGVHPNPLHPVVRLSARVLDIRDVPRREAVGYGATYRTKRASRLAILGIGYKNGLPWSCANRISVRFGNKSAPVIGRISMMLIDLWGGLHDGERALPGAVAALNSLRSAGVRICLLSNSPRRATAVAARLRRWASHGTLTIT